MCMKYLCGFCPDGPECKFMHPMFDLPVPDPAQQGRNIVCHYCGETGHKALFCQKMPDDTREEQQFRVQFVNHLSGAYRRDHDDGGGPSTGRGKRNLRPLDQVTCYKCGEKGHYANKCPKGHLAFLSSALHNSPYV
ncbi:hypothetical protein MTO96_014619 [Rhipicephalus appendiculatus]